MILIPDGSNNQTVMESIEVFAELCMTQNGSNKKDISVFNIKS